MNFEQLAKKYNGKGIEDCGAYTGDEFAQFSKDFRSALKEFAHSFDGQCVNYSKGHYDVSGFIEHPAGYVYVSYSVPRGEYPINASRRDPMEGVLYRKAESMTDYHGGPNQFTSLKEFTEDVGNFIDREISRQIGNRGL